jgi:hypothetical protein
MNITTLFTFGYWGWGNSTRQLAQLVDTVEKHRGYNPPLFVDLRISRAVRAIGFNGEAFLNTVGNQRYRWFSGLGNVAILEGGRIRLKDAKNALGLLYLSLSQVKQNRRVIAFCACEYPRIAGNIACHRVTVADKVISYAREEGRHVNIVEWPGYDTGENSITLKYPNPDYTRILRGAKWIPIERQLSLPEGQVQCRGISPSRYRAGTIQTVRSICCQAQLDTSGVSGACRFTKLWLRTGQKSNCRD